MTVLHDIDHKTPKIDEISNLQDLKPFACTKVQYKKDWYLDCVDCKGRNGCPAGKRAVFLTEHDMAPKGEESFQDIQQNKLRDNIIHIFSQSDPVKELLSTSGNVKPQSIYQRVNMWRKNYPDLEEKYHMLEKVRFLWTKPYDSMRVPDILKMMYPEPPKETPKSTPKPIEVRTKVIDIDPPTNSDEMSLEDFLDSIPEATPTKKLPDEAYLVVSKAEPEVKSRETSGELDKMIERLQMKLSDLEKQKAEILHQLEAIKTVQNLMKIGI